MAARRLIIVLLLLLAASVVAAAIAPDRTGRFVGLETDSSTTSTEETTPPSTTTTEADGTEVETGGPEDDFSTVLHASANKPKSIEGFVGDQLSLDVASDPARSISIPSLGLTEFASPSAPAHFDLLLQQPGTVRIVDGEDPDVVVGRLIIKEPVIKKPGAKKPGARKPDNGK